MLKRSLLLGTAVAGVLVANPGFLRTDHAGLHFVSPAHAQRSSNVDISIFFDELAPHGRWLSTRRHGYVWVPARVAQDWRPYSDGHWVYTRPYGWLWVSDEPYGWAVYHYGRWGYDDDQGWFWVPGSEWAPAWVSWQYSDEYVGWAALPPSGSGYAFSIGTGAITIGIGAWRFVPTRNFLDSNVQTHILVGNRNPEVLRATRPAGSVRVVNNVVVNNVINVTNVERVVARKVVVHEVTTAEKAGPITDNGQVVRAFRPAIAKTQPKAVPKQAAAAELENKPAALKVDAKAQGKADPKQTTEPARQPEPQQNSEGKGKAEPKQTIEPKRQPEPQQKSESKGQAEPKQTIEPKRQPEPQQKSESKGKSEPKAGPESKGQPEPK